MAFKVFICVALTLTVLGFRIVNRWVFKRLKFHLPAQNRFVLEKTSFYLISSILVVLALRMIGLDIEGIIATAGVMTIAIGFAAKTSISNVISGGIMLSTKMIQIEDLIEVDTHVGVVENVNFFSTQLRTFDNILITIPNEKLMTEYVKNYSKYSIRRSVHQVTIDYDDFHSALVDDLCALVSEVEGVLLEPNPFVLVEGQQGRGITISIRIWCETQDLVIVRDRLMTEVFLFLKRADVHLWSESIYIRST